MSWPADNPAEWVALVEQRSRERAERVLQRVARQTGQEYRPLEDPVAQLAAVMRGPEAEQDTPAE